MMRRALLPVLVALALAGCGSSPKTQYFTLSAVPAPAGETASVSTPVTVAAVHVPPSLDRREMVRRTGQNRVEISGQDRWTASLGEMTRRVLSQDLAARLPEDKLVPPDAPAVPHMAQIVVTLVQFGPDAKGGVTLDGSWSLLEGAREKPVLRRTVTLETPPSTETADGQAAAMSRLLGELATRIAQTLAETPRRDGTGH